MTLAVFSPSMRPLARLRFKFMSLFASAAWRGAVESGIQNGPKIAWSTVYPI